MYRIIALFAFLQLRIEPVLDLLTANFCHKGLNFSEEGKTTFVLLAHRCRNFDTIFFLQPLHEKDVNDLPSSEFDCQKGVKSQLSVQ